MAQVEKMRLSRRTDRSYRSPIVSRLLPKGVCFTACIESSPVAVTRMPRTATRRTRSPLDCRQYHNTFRNVRLMRAPPVSGCWPSLSGATP